MPVLKKKLKFYNDMDSKAVVVALNDLERDFKQIYSAEISYTNDESDADLKIIRNSDILDSEGYHINIGKDRIVLKSSSELGAVYGIYRISRDVLGVDQLWFWKDTYPEPTEYIELSEQEIVSESHTFKYRGWFLNDEDLLTEWHDFDGRRNIDYAFYSQVVAPDVIEAVYEAALRCGANMIIPASFVDIMNPYEAKLIEMAVARGLYVTQHHIEPLGVSHFGFENYWKAKGEKFEFSYGREREKVIEAWSEFAAEWYKIAGDRVIWQLGLRGKGDKAIWQSDKTVSREKAGKFISEALEEQIKIVNSIDRRSKPPVTVTLWDEMSDLMIGGELKLPSEAIIVFSDRGQSQEMDEDFYAYRNLSENKIGIYYHIAFWIRGAHLVQGVSPRKIEEVYRCAIDRGYTEYSIVNVGNIREHVLGIEAVMGLMTDSQSWDYYGFMHRFGRKFADIYQKFFDTYVKTPEGYFQDGDAVRMLDCLVCCRRKERNDLEGVEWGLKALEAYGINSVKKRKNFAEKLLKASHKFDAITELVYEDSPTFYKTNLKYQAKLIAVIYRIASKAALAIDCPVDVDDIKSLIDQITSLFKTVETGKWKNWYRGEKKANWSSWKQQLEKFF